MVAFRVLLIQLLKAITDGGAVNGKKYKFAKVHMTPTNTFQRLANLQQAFEFLRVHGVAKGGQLVNIQPAAIAAGDRKQTLALIWVLIGVQVDAAANAVKKSTSAQEKMKEGAEDNPVVPAIEPRSPTVLPAAGAEPLLHWCQGVVSPYIAKALCGDAKSFGTSFRDGRLFAVLIHAHLPEAIDPASLGVDAKKNLAQVMQVVSQYPALQIPPMAARAVELMLTSSTAGKLVTMCVNILHTVPAAVPHFSSNFGAFRWAVQGHFTVALLE